MSVLFERTKMKSITLRNRFVRSATYEAMAAEDGSCTNELTELLLRLADGEIGLIISSHAFVSPRGQAGPFQIGIYDNSLIDSYREMTQKVHENGCDIIMQIAHAGNYASAVLTDEVALVPSRVDGVTRKRCKEMDSNDIQDVIESFGQAGRRAREAGFNGVQVHAAHGYLLNQFLSPYFNRRNDKYGGAVENRSRILVEILERIRSYAGPDFPVLIKINCQDFQDNGLSLEDSIKVVEILQGYGLDAVELSGGTFIAGKFGPIRVGITSIEKESYFKQEAQEFKKHIKIPLMLVGGMRSFELVEKLVIDGIADYISMSRPLIHEPGLIARWRSGNHQRSDCVSDNLCLTSAISGGGLYCVTEEKKKNV